jgi:hypothetical protein
MSSTIRRLLVFALASLGPLTMPACAAQATYYRAREPRVVDTRTYDDSRAYDVGYREGFQLGRDDARRGRAFDYTRHREYRQSGQRSWEGDDPRPSRFRRVYRNGFATGYNDAYRQFARRW